MQGLQGGAWACAWDLTMPAPTYSTDCTAPCLVLLPVPLYRRALGMDLTKPAVLLVGGGEGMGPVERTVDGVAKVSAAVQWVVGLLYAQSIVVSLSLGLGQRMCHSLLRRCLPVVPPFRLPTCPPAYVCPSALCRPAPAVHRRRLPAGGHLRAQRQAGGEAAEQVSAQSCELACARGGFPAPKAPPPGTCLSLFAPCLFPHAGYPPTNPTAPVLCRQYPEGMRVLVKGFVTNMPELMCASGEKRAQCGSSGWRLCGCMAVWVCGTPARADVRLR